MFRKMRRKRQMLSDEETVKILEKCTSGVLAVDGDEGYPYAVPLSYLYHNSKIYFHCAKSGHKLDALKNNSKVSFCVIEQDNVIPEKYTTVFRSVICFGKAHIIEDDTEKRRLVELLALKYAPNDTEQNRNAYIDDEFSAMCMVEIDIEHMTGKEGIELTKEREKNRA